MTASLQLVLSKENIVLVKWKPSESINHVLHNFFSLVPMFLLLFDEKKQKRMFMFSVFFCQWTSGLVDGLEWFRSTVLQLGLFKEIVNLVKGSFWDIDSEYLYIAFCDQVVVEPA